MHTHRKQTKNVKSDANKRNRESAKGQKKQATNKKCKSQQSAKTNKAKEKREQRARKHTPKKNTQTKSDEDRKLFSGICSLEYDILKVPKSMKTQSRFPANLTDHLTSNTSEISFGMWNLECDIGMVRGPLGFLESGIFLESSRGLLGIWNLI